MYFRKILHIAFLCCSFNLIAQQPSFVKGQVFVKFKELDNSSRAVLNPKGLPYDVDYYLSRPSVSRVLDYYRLQEVDAPFSNSIEMNSTFVLQFLSTDTDEIILALEESSVVEYAEKVPLMETSQLPSDVNIRQWEHNAVDSKLAWGEYLGESNVVLAIVDDAVLLNHEDLNPNIWVNPGEIANNNIDDDNNGYVDDINGWDAADQDNDPNPPVNATSSHFSHGTHCAGTAGARTDNGIGIASLAGKAKIMAVKTKLSNSTGGSLQAAYAGLAYAISANADVISMSWGSYYFSRTYQELINSAHEKGIVMIAAAGNNNTETPMYPAGYNHVISVGASTQADTKASFSNYGSHIDVMAPGVNIYSTVPGGDNNNYSYKSGTSMACPLVASLATYLLSRNTELTPDDILDCLASNSDYIEDRNVAYTGLLGAGRINAYNSLSCSAKIIAKFEVDARDACPGSQRSFVDMTTNDPTSWEWSFPGGFPNTSSVRNPTVSYSASGTYDVQLIAENAEGKDTLLLRNLIHVTTPSASMGGDILIYPGTKGYVEVSLEGTAPYSFSYSEGQSIKSIDNISSSPYYIEVEPSNTTTYSLLSMASTECSGTVSGTTMVEVSQSAIPCYSLINRTRVSPGYGGLGTEEELPGMGAHIAILDDYDGDGVKELAVGSRSTTADEIWIMYMNANGTVKSKKAISYDDLGATGPSVGSRDIVMETIGDVDGNGYVDIAVSNKTDDGNEIVIVLLGKDAEILKVNRVGANRGGLDETFAFGVRFGYGLGNIGDFNNDGIPDLATTKFSSVGTRSTTIYLLFLDRTGSVASYSKIDEFPSNTDFDKAGLFFGHDIENIGDLDDDGVSDLAIGSPYFYSNGQPRQGRVLIAFMNADGTVKKYAEITDHTNGVNETQFGNSTFGWEIEPVGDMNNDGVEDIVVSRTGALANGSNAYGAVFFLFLNKDGSVKEYHVIDQNRGNCGVVYNGLLTPPRIGTAIQLLGDVDGDGGLDFAVGASGSQNENDSKGAFYIFNVQPFCGDQCELKADFGFSNVCIGEEVPFREEASLGDGDITTREWTIDGTVVKDSIEFSYLFDTPGEYQIQLLVADNSGLQCRDSITYTVEVENIIDFTVSEEELPCLGDSISLNVSNEVCSQGPYTYEWSGHLSVVGENSPELSFLPLEDMVLTIKVTDFFGASKTKKVIIDVDESCCYSRAIIEQSKEYYCLGEPITLINKSIARFAPSYEWLYNAPLGEVSVRTENIEPLNFPKPGKFQVRLVQQDLCKSDTVVINIHVMDLPDNVLEDKDICSAGDSIGVQEISTYDYEWSPKTGLDNPYSGITYVSNSTVSTYVLTVTDVVTQCASSEEMSVTYNDGCILGVNKINDVNTGIYPNPVVDELNVNLDFELLEIYSVTGTLIGQYKSSVVSVGELAKGVYILKVIGKNNEVTNYQFIKK